MRGRFNDGLPSTGVASPFAGSGVCRREESCHARLGAPRRALPGCRAIFGKCGEADLRCPRRGMRASRKIARKTTAGLPALLAAGCARHGARQGAPSRPPDNGGCYGQTHPQAACLLAGLADAFWSFGVRGVVATQNCSSCLWRRAQQLLRTAESMGGCSVAAAKLPARHLARLPTPPFVPARPIARSMRCMLTCCVS